MLSTAIAIGVVAHLSKAKQKTNFTHFKFLTRSAVCQSDSVFLALTLIVLVSVLFSGSALSVC